MLKLCFEWAFLALLTFKSEFVPFALWDADFDPPGWEYFIAMPVYDCE